MVIPVTADTYSTEVKSHPGRVVIDFYTPFCGPCRAMAPMLDQLSTELGEAVKIVKIDASVESDLAAEFGVRAVPTFVLLDQGVKKAEIKGMRSKADFEKWLKDN